jgi:hypothetical protein
MPQNFLDGFESNAETDLGEGLIVRDYHRKAF